MKYEQFKRTHKNVEHTYERRVKHVNNKYIRTMRAQWNVFFLNSSVMTGNKKLCSLCFNCMAPAGFEFAVYRWLRQWPSEQLVRNRSNWAFSVLTSRRRYLVLTLSTFWVFVHTKIEYIVLILGTVRSVFFLTQLKCFTFAVRTHSLKPGIGQRCLFTQAGRSSDQNSGHSFIDGQSGLADLNPGSSRVKDALGDTIPPAPPVRRNLCNVVPADVHFPEFFSGWVCSSSVAVDLASFWSPRVPVGEIVAGSSDDSCVKDVQPTSYVCIG